MPEVAIIFFGINRSVLSTMASIKKHIYSNKFNPDWSFYTIASLNLPGEVNSPRSHEVGVKLNDGDIFELAADAYVLCGQDDEDIAPFLSAARQQRDEYKNDWASIKNLLHQLASLRRAWDFCQGVLKRQFDYFLFVRPDLEYLDDFPLKDLARAFTGEGNIAVPEWHSFGGLNDRFAFADAVAAQAYAKRIELVFEYCKKSSLHPESFLQYALRQSACKVWGLPVRARRVRATGVVVDEDFAVAVKELPSASVVAGDCNGMESKTIPSLPRCDVLQEQGKRSKIVVQDGFLRVAALRGLDYLKFLEALHKAQPQAAYMEIGTQKGDSLQYAKGKALAIDPNFLLDKDEWRQRGNVSLYEMTSDAFFAAHDPRVILGETPRISFIDGMHLAEFVLRDFINVERHSDKSSVIILHDVIPQNFEMTERDRRPERRPDKPLAGAWTGDVWRVIGLLRRERPDLHIRVLDCPPTGLAVVSNLDPQSSVLAARVEQLVQELTEVEAKEEEFWAYIDKETFIDSRVASV